MIKFMRGVFSQNIITKLGFKAAPRHEYEFLPAYLAISKRPPVPFARALGWGLCVVVLLILLWSIIGKLDIIANAQGKLLVSGNSKIIQSLQTAGISAIHVQDGQIVKKGELLIELNAVSAASDVAQLKSQWLNARFEVAVNQALLNQTPDARLELSGPLGAGSNTASPNTASQSSILNAQQIKHYEPTKTLYLAALKRQWQEYQAQITTLDSELSSNRAQLATVNTQMQSGAERSALFDNRKLALESLVKQNLYSQIEFESSENERLQLSGEHKMLQARVKELNSAAHTLAAQKEQYTTQRNREWQQALSEAKGTQQNLEQQWLKIREAKRQTRLHSPVDGVVQQLNFHTLGGVVSSAEPIMVIVPLDEGLVASVNISNQDIGFVRAGQAVEIKVDAFPFTKYGTVPSEIIHVSKDAVADEDLGWVFPAKVRLERNYIEAKSGRIQLAAGMSVVAEIKTDERRIIDYILSPIAQYQAEAIRER